MRKKAFEKRKERDQNPIGIVKNRFFNTPAPERLRATGKANGGPAGENCSRGKGLSYNGNAPAAEHYCGDWRDRGTVVTKLIPSKDHQE